MNSGHLRETLMQVYDMRPSTAEAIMEIAEYIDGIAKKEYERGYTAGVKVTKCWTNRINNRKMIYLDDAINAVKKHYRKYDNDLLELIAFDIERLPSAQPELYKEKNT